MTRTAFRLAAALALLSTSQLQAAAPAPARPCLTPAELRAMVSYAIPSVLDSVIGRCRPVLPADASLLKHGVELVREFDSGRVAAFPLARRGFAKFSDKSAKNTALII